MLNQILPAELFVYAIVFARIGSAIMVIPGFGERYVPARIRIMIALALTIIITPLVRDSLPALPAQPLALVGLIGGEVIVGLFIGGVSRLLISALHVAGVVISFLSGLSYAQTIDPSQGLQGAIVGSLMSMSGLVLIFSTGLHAILLAGLVDSYQLFTPNEALPTADFAEMAVGLVSDAFVLGFKIATPFMIYGLVFYIGLGILQRLNPQVQLFFIAMPLQMMFAILAMTFVLTAGLQLFLVAFTEHTQKFLVLP